MWKLKHLFMNAVGEGGEGGGAGDGGNPGTGDVGSTSLLSTGAQNQPGGDDWVPEKFRVMGEDGKLNIEGSARKLAESYTHLEKQRGTSAVPKTVDEYAPTVDVEGFKWDEFKADPEMQGFLKAAHAKGITNDQMGFILGKYMNRAPALVGGAAELDQEAAATELRGTWKTDAEFQKNIGLAHRAFMSLADPADQGKMDEIGNNPMVIRMLAKIGVEMGEDTPVGNGQINLEEQQIIRDLMKSEAYTNPKHADYERVTAQVRAFYQKTYGEQAVA
ncbi:TPA: hypothetical protein ACQVMA_000314 [Serratia marcescens]|uniref:Uncharacterized protein n=1 Tax=Serratia marcescens TaxID=615 RepID=A0A2F0PKK8_SERMA|nr:MULTISPECIES: hypothetical protein [Serratia]AUY15278.1 hypothetical protein C3F38_16225 [Serratia sp. SSNIH1]MDK4857063.1 hypothetical protein [Serratia nevei]MDK5108005.1 hypothetical protein [Serratia nevei]MDK5112959.1 hypothetical protein [Serratia nevei]MDK5703366.1 hypothetical protein [Serratia nevei]